MSLLRSTTPGSQSAGLTPMVTMRQVAAEAGVSYTTVSFVINGNDTARGIGAATRERVLETAKRLGYRHNGLARAVSTGRSQVLAVAVQTLELEFRARILSGVLEAAEAAGYFVKVVALADTVIPTEKIEQLASSRVAGVIAVNVEANSLQRLRQEIGCYGGLVATVDDINPHGTGIRVTSDNRRGTRLAFEHLRALGHERIALLSGPQVSPLVRERQTAFCELLKRDNLNEFPIVRTGEDWNLTEEHKAQIRAILEKTERPTAFLCTSDLLAMRVLDIATQLELRVPRDLSLIGYGNFLISEIAVPTLSSIGQPFHQMGASATLQLLRALEADAAGAPKSEAANAAFTDFTEILPVHLVARESSGPAPTNSLAQSEQSES